MSEHDPNPSSPWPGWRYRVASVLLLGLPVLTLGMSLGIHLAEAHFRTKWLTPQALQAIVVVNGVIAASGALVSGLLAEGPTAQRVARAITAGLLGAYFYTIGWGVLSVFGL